MIEESYVSFDTAKLLKEAGFDVPCFNQYTERGTIWHCDCPENFNKSQCATSCPTQSLATRWLREVHRIVVDATFIPPSTDGNDWQYFIGNMDDMVWKSDFEPSERKYTTYEAALEEGLQEAIKYIKSKDYEEDNVQ